MEITRWTQYIDRGAYMGVAPGVKNVKAETEKTAPNADTVIISEEARRAALTAKSEQSDVPRGSAGKLSSGEFTVVEPDWDSFEAQMLEGQADPKVYKDAYMKAYLKELGALTKKVEEHYAPAFSNIQGKDISDAMSYLFTTYKMPWMKDVFLPGTSIPLPPDGMSQAEANMTYDQLKSMYANDRISVLRDPYALGADGIDRLNNIEKNAHTAAQTTYDEAQKEYEIQQNFAKVEQKERSKRMYQSLSSGNATRLGYMSLRAETEEGSAD